MSKAIKKNRYLLSSLLWMVSFLMCTIGGHAQSKSLSHHRTLTQKTGLSNNKITSIVKDSLGSCWIGSYKGLNRVLENKIISYDNDSRFKNQEILFVLTDSLHQVWAATWSGLYRYNTYSNQFEDIILNSHKIVASHYDFTKGGILFNCSDGIVKYHYQTGAIKLLQPRLYYDTPYSCFQQLNDSIAIVAIDSKAIYKLNLTTNDHTPFITLAANQNLTDALIDSAGCLWVGIHNKGLIGYCTESGVILHRFTKENSKLSDNTILQIKQYGQQLWLTTDGSGINQLNLKTHKLVDFQHPYGEQFISNVNSILSIYHDQQDEEIWLGTVRHGAICVKKSRIRSYETNDIDARFTHQSSSIIQCLCEDYDGNIWFGTDGAGVYCYDPIQETFTHLQISNKLKVVSIENIDDNNLLISAYNKGIYKISKHNQYIRKIPIVNDVIDDALLAKDLIIDLAQRSKNEIYIIANDLYIYKIPENRIESLGAPNIAANRGFTHIHTDSTHSYVHNFNDIYSIHDKNKSIDHIYRATRGDFFSIRKYGKHLWINKNYRLARLELDTKHLEEVAFPYNDHILSIEIDSVKQQLWLLTYDKLICCNINNIQDYQVYADPDGLKRNEYFGNISHLSKSGYIYLGGNSGLCIIDNNQEGKKENSKHLNLIEVLINDKPYTYSKNAQHDFLIKLPWDYQSLKVSVSSDGGNVFKSTKYKFTLHGGAKNTILQADNQISLPTLTPGEYKLDIAYLGANDQWIDNSNHIEIIVTHPWWQNSLLIFIIYILLISISLYLIYSYYKRRKQDVIEVHKQNTQELAENKVNFLTNVSHELRTPLTLIYAPLKRMLDGDDLQENTRQELSKIYTQSKQMIRLINMVLDTRKIEEGYDELHIEGIELNEWARQIADEFEGEYRNKKISLNYQFDPHIRTINFDQAKCRIALSNFLMNALKYSDSNTSITLQTELLDKFVRISVIDEGIGLKNIDIASLFNRFMQAHDKSKGAGLGLAYAKLLIECHNNARIDAYANNTKGSTFYFELPTDLKCQRKELKREILLDFDNDVNIPSMEHHKELDVNTNENTLLIVEDEVELLHFMKDALTPYFKQIHIAADGKHGLDIAIKHAPDIIISDVMMPNMNGYELCRQIRNKIEISHTPIILLTAQNNTTHCELGYKSGADVFLGKPFDIESLYTVIKNTIINRNIIKQKYKNKVSKLDITKNTFSSPDEQFMLKLNQFIQDNISNEDLNVQSIIDHMCMGRASFYKKLKDITNMGVMEYVTTQRMNTAAQMLTHTALTISEIANNVGYFDSQHFSRTFKQHYNAAPTSYRKTYKTIGPSQ